ncbi:MAG: hypothetical protein AB1640_15750, partial [bacterium]
MKCPHCGFNHEGWGFVPGYERVCVKCRTPIEGEWPEDEEETGPSQPGFLRRMWTRLARRKRAAQEDWEDEDTADFPPSVPDRLPSELPPPEPPRDLTAHTSAPSFPPLSIRPPQPPLKPAVPTRPFPPPIEAALPAPAGSTEGPAACGDAFEPVQPEPQAAPCEEAVEAVSGPAPEPGFLVDEEIGRPAEDLPCPAQMEATRPAAPAAAAAAATPAGTPAAAAT